MLGGFSGDAGAFEEAGDVDCEEGADGGDGDAELDGEEGVLVVCMQARVVYKDVKRGTYDPEIDFHGTGDPEGPSIPGLIVAFPQCNIDIIGLYDARDADDEAEAEEREDSDALLG